MTKEDFEHMESRFYSANSSSDKIALHISKLEKNTKIIIAILISILIIAYGTILTFYIAFIIYILMLMFATILVSFIFQKIKYEEHMYDMFVGLSLLISVMLSFFLFIIMALTFSYGILGFAQLEIDAIFTISINLSGWYRDIAMISFSFSIGLIIVTSLIPYVSEKYEIEKSCMDGLTELILESDKKSYLEFISEQDEKLKVLFEKYSGAQEIQLIIRRLTQLIFIFIIFGILFILLDIFVIYGLTVLDLSSSITTVNTAVDYLILLTFFMALLVTASLILKFVPIVSKTIINIKELNEK